MPNTARHTRFFACKFSVSKAIRVSAFEKNRAPTTGTEPSISADSGFVLITVVGLLLMLTVITATLLTSSRSEIKARAALNSQA